MMIRIWFLLLLFLSNGVIYCQDKKILIQDANKDYFNQDIRFYASLVHQHQNFFQKPFSFQGLETGILINQRIQFGFYGATFISNLKIEKAGHPLYIFISQGGLLGSRLMQLSNKINVGGQMNIGFFDLTADSTDFKLFETTNKLIKLNGLILSPQVFGEYKITNWLKIRTGIAYSFLAYEDQSEIPKADLESISLAFGFILGKF